MITKPLLLLAFAAGLRAATAIDADVIVVAATPSGIAAAINAARNGATVALFESTHHIGGMTSSGMANTDFKSFESVQGAFREFMNGVVAYYTRKYGPASQQVKDCYHGAWYEPSVAQAVFEGMLAAERRIRVFRHHRLLSLVKIPGSAKGQSTIHSTTFQDTRTGQTLDATAKVFIDATYEGDLMAMAGARFTVGRESSRQYGERLAGVIYQLDGRILPGSTGEGDRRVQCYNFRLCLTRDPANRLPISRPVGYRRREFLPLLDYIRRGVIKSVDEGVVRFRPLPNLKADVNDLMTSPFSLRLTGVNHEWPEGDASTRERISSRYRLYSLSLFYFLQNDREVPEALRAEARRWGLPRDEFAETAHFPPLLYVREARRMVGGFVFTEQMTQPTLDSVRAPVQADSIAVADYSLDCHGEQAPTMYHPGVTEGKFASPTVPFQIPYRVMLPREVDNLLVPVAVSASHVGYSAIRMEPTFAALGQAAGVAAAMAVSKRTTVLRVPVAELQQRLWRAKAITVYFSDVLPGSPDFARVQRFGTLGYFHHVVDRDRVTWSRPKPLGTGQWTEAHPHHAAGLNETAGEELAERWERMSGIKPLDPNLTRGQLLRQIEEKRR
ncbi:MAG: FAD-dependent oxidoreductase [Bryobacteraceae bacterium]|nr:FAD-dependent oxidoreductase [Bryobacteraceae bacterium]